MQLHMLELQKKKKKKKVPFLVQQRKKCKMGWLSSLVWQCIPETVITNEALSNYMQHTALLEKLRVPVKNFPASY